jgi:hypothetical protein
MRHVLFREKTRYGVRHMAVFYVFVRQLFNHWRWFMTSGPLTVEALLSQTSAAYQAWANRYISAAHRRRATVWLAIFGILVASFMVFSDEYRQLQIAQQQLIGQGQGVALAGFWPRSNNDQKTTLTGMFRHTPAGIAVECNDPGCAGLEKDLVDVFRNAGWSATGRTSINAIATGIFIEGAKDDVLAKTVREKIQRVTGFRIGYSEEAHFDDKIRMAIIIGTKADD